MPQGKDPAWNAACSRNRRVFDDRAVRKVGAHTKQFLLQTYRRNMGGGEAISSVAYNNPGTITSWPQE